MKPSADRSARGRIQQSLGPRGVVLPRVEQTVPGRRFVGWYAQLTTASPGCDCEACAAARNGQVLYLGFHLRDAIEQLGIYKHAHPEAA